MIRAAIVGAESSVAGDVIRILINHPDVELVGVCAPELEGLLLSQFHKGLTGETYMRFSSSIPSDINALFLCFTSEGDSERYLRHHPVSENVRIIDLSPDFRTTEEESEWVYGLPELNRKPLVRGAKRASIPGPYATSVLLALLPMAKNLLLNSDIHVSAVGPSAQCGPGEAIAVLDHEEVDEMKFALRQLQSSFDRDIHFVATAGGWRQGISLTLYFDTPISEDQIKNLYDEFYEDHSFTFLTDSLPDLNEVRGTNKCLIHLQKSDDKLIVSVVIDDSLKGGAAAAVHAMNLLFGLQERVGLMLKATAD